MNKQKWPFIHAFNARAQFYKDTIVKPVPRRDNCINMLTDYVEK
jgi:hypothetical protein